MSNSPQGVSPGRHVFVVVEGGPYARDLKWPEVRSGVLADHGFLSLALTDGKESRWVVRPAPVAGQIPETASTSAAKPASTGIGNAVIDQVVQAQVLIPAITSTEIRLYGGALVETELNNAVKGEASIQLRVFDRSGLRAARSTYVAPRVKTAAPVVTSTPKPAASTPATTKPAVTTTPMRPNPNSAAGRQAAASSTASTPSFAAASAAAASKLAWNQQQVRVRRHHDRNVFLVALLLSGTVIVPWLIGFLVFRDHFVLSTGPGVYNTDIRNLWNYFGALYLAGLGAICVLLAAFFLLRSWSGRALSVVTGIVAAVVAFVFIFPSASSIWSTQESVSAQLLQTTAYPFENNNVVCGWQQATVKVDGQDQLLQVYAAGGTQDVFSTTGCDYFAVWDGWDELNDVDLSSGLTNSGDENTLALAPGTSLATAGFGFIGSDGVVHGFAIQGTTVWNSTLKPTQEYGIAGQGTNVLVSIGPAGGEEITEIVALAGTTGKEVWHAVCPGHRVMSNWTVTATSSSIICSGGIGGADLYENISPTGVMSVQK